MSHVVPHFFSIVSLASWAFCLSSGDAFGSARVLSRVDTASFAFVANSFVNNSAFSAHFPVKKLLIHTTPVAALALILSKKCALAAGFALIAVIKVATSVTQSRFATRAILIAKSGRPFSSLRAFIIVSLLYRPDGTSPKYSMIVSSLLASSLLI